MSSVPKARRHTLTVRTFHPPSLPVELATTTTTPSSSSSVLSELGGLRPVATSRLPLRPKRRPHVEELAAATRELVSDFQKRITDLSLELANARDALTEAQKHQAQSVELPISPGSPTSSHLEHDADGIARLRENLRKLRAQNSHLARSSRQQEHRHTQSMQDLEKERMGRKRAETEAIRLGWDNFALLEHNRLLSNRDTVLQTDHSRLVSKYPEPGHSRGQSLPVNKTDFLDGRPGHPRSKATPHIAEISFESHGALRSSLVDTQDQLYITERRLQHSESRNSILSSRITHLHKAIVLCADQSADALQVERNLRSDIEERLAHVQLQRHIEKPLADAWRHRNSELRQIEEKARTASRCLKGLSFETSATTASDDHPRVQLLAKTPTSLYTPLRKSRPTSFISPDPSLVSAPTTPSRKSPRSRMLALTLSKRSGVNAKSNPSISVDIVHSYKAKIL